MATARLTDLTALQNELTLKIVSTDIQEPADALRQLLDTRMSLIVDCCNDAIIAKTLDGIIVAWNPAAESMYHYAAEEIVGKNVSLLFPPDKKVELSAILEKIRRGERVEHYESVRVTKDGVRIEVSVTVSPIIGPRGDILGASAIARDITERKKWQEHIQYLATHDSLTGLANYGTLMEAFDAELRRSDRTGKPFSVVLLDVDRLKIINDRFGHLAGSRALCRVAHILEHHCRSIDMAARYGGDEFAILLTETDKQAACCVVERIARQLTDDDEKPLLSASMGVSTYPDDGLTAEGLLAIADHALYQRKLSSAGG